MHKKNREKHQSSYNLAIYHPDTEIRTWLVGLVSKNISKSNSNKYMLLWQADTAEELINKIEQQPVDALLMDVSNAKLNVKNVLSHCQDCLILLLSNKNNQTGEIFNALGAGATDVATLTRSYQESQNEVVVLDKLQVILSLLRTKPKLEAIKQSHNDINLVVVGSSTGGPEALRQMIGPLSQEIKAAIVIVQHLDNLFINEFVSWLAQHCQLPVSIAEQGKAPKVGHIYVAHPRAHLVVDKHHCFNYVEKPGQYSYQPSINAFFTSVNKYWRNPGCAIILTGMGKDGAKGLKKLLDSGWKTFAQEKKSCAVYGMPKAALEMGAVEKNQSLSKITDIIRDIYTECHSGVECQHGAEHQHGAGRQHGSFNE